jgi:hypothetical protein
MATLDEGPPLTAEEYRAARLALRVLAGATFREDAYPDRDPPVRVASGSIDLSAAAATEAATFATLAPWLRLGLLPGAFLHLSTTEVVFATVNVTGPL